MTLMALATLHSYLHRPVVGPGQLAHSTHDHDNTVNVLSSVKDMAFTISKVSLPVFIWKGSFIKTFKILLTTKVFYLSVSIRKCKIIIFLVNPTNQGWSILRAKWEAKLSRGADSVLFSLSGFLYQSVVIQNTTPFQRNVGLQLEQHLPK